MTVARDVCASIHPELADAAPRLMELNMHARIAARAEALDPVSANLSLRACEDVTLGPPLSHQGL